MRILMLAQFYWPAIGGEERHVRDLSAFLAKCGHWVGVATLWRRGLPEHEIDQGVEIFRIRGQTQSLPLVFSSPDRTHAPPFPDPGLVSALNGIIASKRVDVVHAHNWLLHSFLPLKRAGGPRLVVTLHDLSLVCATKTAMRGNEACSGPSILKCSVCTAQHYGAVVGPVTLATNTISSMIERRLVDCFLPVSRAIAVANKLPGGPTPYQVVPNFVRDDVAILEDDAVEHVQRLPLQPYFLYVGDLRRFKGVDVLADAWSSVPNVPPLVMIGRQCHDTPAIWPANVHVFHDWPHGAVMHAWNRSMAGVLASVGPEACATVLMEGMASGKPMIASNIGGNPDIVESGVSGLLVQPGDRTSLAAAISALVTDEGLRNRLSAGALRRAQAFRASGVVPRIEAVYREVLARPQRAVKNAEQVPAEVLSPRGRPQ